MMVDSGMSEMDAIRAATVVAAELIEMSDSLGTIEAGKLADMIAVLTGVAVVIKDGIQVKQVPGVRPGV